MIESIGTLFIHKPLNILLIALVMVVCWALARGLRAPRPNALVAPIVAPVLYAGWGMARDGAFARGEHPRGSHADLAGAAHTHRMGGVPRVSLTTALGSSDEKRTKPR